jgi:hypothetical protein
MGDENKRKLLSENAIKRAENFELKVVADKWEKLFKKLKSPKE